MKISYAITVCNEFDEIQRLILFLLENKRNEDEIVILYDINNGHEGIEQFLKEKSINKQISWIPGEFNGHFAEWKNKLTSLCTGDYIYQIDADEMINEYILRLLPQVLEQNDVDVLLVPRINTVSGLIQHQWRIYKNNKNIKWKNKVHEVLDGYKTMSHLPTEKEWCLIHEKTIKRQETQNAYYDTL